MNRFMRGLIAVLLAFALLSGGAAAFAAQGVFAFLGGTYADFADRFAENTPVAVCYTEHTMGSGPDSYLWDAASVQQLFDALSAITVGKSDQRIATDSDYIYSFVMADGSQVHVLFNQNYLQKDDVRYEVENTGALAAMQFPAYSRSFTPFDVCFDADMTAFADGFDTDTPVSVGFSRDGGPAAAVSDADFIREVFYALSSAEIGGIETDQTVDMADAAKSVFTFTMADERTHALTLYSLPGYDGALRDYVAVQPAVEQLGMQYYMLDGTEPLWALQFDGYEDVKPSYGITDALLPLYGAEMAALFEFENRGAFETLTVTHRRAGETAEEITFLESDFEAVSDMAQKFDEMDYSEQLDAAPDSEDAYTFAFTDAAGETCTLEFCGDCALVPAADGSTGYYRIVHGDIEENGLMDLVYQEQQLLAWKNEVNFRGEGKPDTAGTIRGILVIAAALVVLAGIVIAIVLLSKRARAKKRAAGEKPNKG